MEFMGWSIIFETDEVVGYKSDRNGDLWFVKSDKSTVSDYDAKGVNHISLRVAEMANVDEVKSHLETKNVKMLFDTPKHRPEFTASENEMYYQIMFESPDNILFEIVYIGMKKP